MIRMGLLMVVVIGLLLYIVYLLVAPWLKARVDKHKRASEFKKTFTDIPHGDEAACYNIGYKAMQHGVPAWQGIKEIQETQWWLDGWYAAREEETEIIPGTWQTDFDMYGPTAPDGMWDPIATDVANTLKTSA